MSLTHFFLNHLLILVVMSLLFPQLDHKCLTARKDVLFPLQSPIAPGTVCGGLDLSASLIYQCNFLNKFEFGHHTICTLLIERKRKDEKRGKKAHRNKQVSRVSIFFHLGNNIYHLHFTLPIFVIRIEGKDINLTSKLGIRLKLLLEYLQ